MNNFNNKNCKFLKKNSLSLNPPKSAHYHHSFNRKAATFPFYHFLLLLREVAYSPGSERFWTYVDQIDMESYLAGRT